MLILVSEIAGGKHRVSILLKRARLHAASAVSGRKTDLAEFFGGDACGIAPGLARPVARHARVTAVQSGGLGRVIRPLRPVVVRLEALVAALVPQRLLVCPREVAVPCEEVSLVELGQVLIAAWANLTVPWIEVVWLICVATKSSYCEESAQSLSSGLGKIGVLWSLLQALQMMVSSKACYVDIEQQRYKIFFLWC